MTFKEQLQNSLLPLSPYTETADHLVNRFYYPPNSNTACQNLNHLMAFLRQHINTHFHLQVRSMPCFCIIYTSNGICNLKYDSFDYALPAESIVFLDCQKGFQLYRSNLDSWSSYIILLDGPSVPFFYSLYYKDEIAGFLLPPASSFPDKINQLASYALSSWDNTTSELLLNKLLTDILTTLLFEKDTNSAIHKPLPNHIIKALSFIDQHFTETICLDDIADALNISKYTLAHDYREYIGTPVIESIIEKRISYAKELLSTTETTINDIAATIGFSSDTHFIQTFKKRVGITPLRYRKQHNIHSHTHILNS